MTFYKYHGAGNDFLIADGRRHAPELDAARITALCDRHTGVGADGVMVLENDPERDFRMRYYNSDGSGGMMCGNGGRCIVAFAADLGFRHFSFNAPDGPHYADLVGCAAREAFSPVPRVVRLKMRDVEGAVPYLSESRSSGNVCASGSCPCESPVCDWFLDTGTRHLVRFVDDVAAYDVTGVGRQLRHDPRFAPVGVNVNFVQVNASASDSGMSISVRTFEKGVEDETLACGTGIVASSLATWIAVRVGLAGAGKGICGDVCGVPGSPCRVYVHARIADLSVTFTPELPEDSVLPDMSSVQPAHSIPFRATDIWLEGPAAYICRVEI